MIESANDAKRNEFVLSKEYIQDLRLYCHRFQFVREDKDLFHQYTHVNLTHKARHQTVIFMNSNGS